MAHPEWFSQRPLVLAGDLNSNKIWDAHRKVGNHSAVVKLLDEHRLVSAYHDYFDEPHGEESRHTMFFYRRRDRTFHLDYIFIPREWAVRLKAVEVGKFETWSKLSDHCPVVVDVADVPAHPLKSLVASDLPLQSSRESLDVKKGKKT
jgi:endonuclease/exonuclease/phosphatase family metal-dependent hydrolase